MPRIRKSSISNGAVAILAGLLISGCSLLTSLPDATTTDQRLASIPTETNSLKGRVVIYWDSHQVPFIEAGHDEDAAFALGLVHAHLRLGQMEMFRRISQGRIAEMGGPLATDIDHGLRILNFGKAVNTIAASLSAETRVWLQRFVDGINHYQRNAKTLPLEYTVLGFDREKWTMKDVLTFGRLAGTDVNWLVWFSALKLRKRADWPRLWARLVRDGAASIPSFGGKRDLAALKAILAGLSKSGSNSIAIAPKRSRTGAAIMANDPHLGITLPSIWLIAGIKSPSYHAVGLMVPGLPFFAMGRNRWIAWGGTNMRAASSDLYDVSDLPESALRTRRETIKVRWWFDREISVRETGWGPVLSDAPMLNEDGQNGDGGKAPRLALRWTGHQPSDEIGAMLKVIRARDFTQFRNAFRSFAVSGQNMLYADTAGNIGQVMAVRLPGRNNGPPRDVVLKPREANGAWNRMRGVMDLPFSHNPKKGYLASANNRAADADIALGYFFSSDDRVARMGGIVSKNGRLGIDDVKAMQRDVYMKSAVRLRDLYVKAIDASALSDSEASATPPPNKDTRAAVTLMREWDGHYRTESRGAVAFELFHGAFSRAFYVTRLGPDDASLFLRTGRIKSLLAADLESAPPESLRSPVKKGLAALSAHIGDFANWGEMHRLGIAHPLSFLPLVGGRYRFGDYPVAGSTDTLMKTAHNASAERHDTRYGSNARHISDMSDPDKNYFALIGGQDGWFNSANFADQVPMWLKGQYITVPLRMDSVRRKFSRKIVLSPGGG